MSYTKQGFVDFDKNNPLTASQLIKMEEGIIEAQEQASNNGTSSGAVSVPSTWKTYMDEKVAEINSTAEGLGSKADCFIFITDMHYPSHTKDHAPELIKYIVENTPVKKVFIGGDTINGAQTNEKDIALLRSLRKRFRGLQIFPVRGNHEYWESAVTAEQFWSTMTSECETYCKCSAGKMYYYYDDTTRNIRYIFADSVNGSYSSATTSEEQQNWIKERIKELDNSWTALIVRHHLWEWNTPGTLNTEGTLIKSLLDSVYDEANCTIAGVYAGHSHKDCTVQADKGYLMVTTVSDSYMIRASASATGTMEQAFDVVFFNPSERQLKTIRIGNVNGTDQNRTLTY